MGLRTTHIRPIFHRILANKGKHAAIGSRNWLIEREVRYGGYVSGVRRNIVSQFDRRNPEQLATGEMIGGDRMSPLHHDYGRLYEDILAPFVHCRHRLTIVECGILRGTGLAIWSDLFPQGRIVGLDIDLGHFNSHYDKLISRGAFSNGYPELYEYDSYVDNRTFLANILKGDAIDIFIDDASHSNESILTNFRSAKIHLARNFVYVIEDNLPVYDHFKNEFPQFTTIIPKLSKFGIARKNRNKSFIVVTPPK